MALLGLLTFLWCLPGIGVRSTRGAHVGVDEPQYLLSATSLFDDRDLDIDDELDEERWRTYHESNLPVQTKVLEGGRQISPHDPLLPVVLAVPMGLGGWVAAKVTLAVLAGALAAALLWVAVARLGLALGRAVAAVSCFSLASPLAVYATQVYPELPGALALVLGVAAALGPPTRRCAVGVGLAVTALPWLSVKYAPVAAALTTVALWRWWQAGERRLAGGLVVALGASAAVFAAGHLAIYDGLTPYATGDHFVGGELTVVGSSPNYLGRSRRLVGLLVDRQWGLAAWQPAWLLLVPAVAALVRRRPPWWPFVVLPLAAGWLNATFVALTMQGYWWSGRQTVVVLPLAVLAIAWWAPRWAVIAGLVAGATTWWWLIADGLAERVTWVVHLRDAGAPVHRLLRPLLPDLTEGPTDGDWAKLLAWTVTLVLCAIYTALRCASRTEPEGSGRGDEDAVAGEGADADDALVDLHGDGAVG